MIDRTMRRGIPMTSGARTVADMAHELDDEATFRLVREAVPQLCIAGPRAANRRMPSRRLTSVIDDLLPTEHFARGPVRARRLRRYDTPNRSANRKVEGFRVDFHCPGARLGRRSRTAAHAIRCACRPTTIRDNVLQIAGELVLRLHQSRLTRPPSARGRADRRGAARAWLTPTQWMRICHCRARGRLWRVPLLLRPLALRGPPQRPAGARRATRLAALRRGRRCGAETSFASPCGVEGGCVAEAGCRRRSCGAARARAARWWSRGGRPFVEAARITPTGSSTRARRSDCAKRHAATLAPMLCTAPSGPPPRPRAHPEAQRPAHAVAMSGGVDSSAGPLSWRSTRRRRARRDARAWSIRLPTASSPACAPRR